MKAPSNVSSGTQLAVIYGVNRQMVGRYMKMGRWPKTTKAFVASNQSRITNTHLLNAAIAM